MSSRVKAFSGQWSLKVCYLSWFRETSILFHMLTKYGKEGTIQPQSLSLFHFGKWPTAYERAVHIVFISLKLNIFIISARFWSQNKSRVFSCDREVNHNSVTCNGTEEWSWLILTLHNLYWYYINTNLIQSTRKSFQVREESFSPYMERAGAWKTDLFILVCSKFKILILLNDYIHFFTF